MRKQVMVNQRHTCGGGCGCGRAAPAKPGSATALLADIHATAKRVDALVGKREEQAARHIMTPAGEVVGLVESPPEERLYMPPRPYWTTNETLSDEQVSALEAERNQLLADLRHQPWSERVRSEARIKEIERVLKSDRLDRGVARRKEERSDERTRQADPRQEM